MFPGAALSDHAGRQNSFRDRIKSLLARIDCRPATSNKRRAEIFHLRYEAGMRERALSQHSSLTFSDRYDNAGNVHLFGLYIDNELASSIRLHIASKYRHQFPSLDAFADVLQSELEAGQVVVDCTRFVADERLAQIYRELPYATLRLCMLAAEHFKADYLITAASPTHQAFYRRAFNFRPISGPRLHPDVAIPVRLMTLNYPAAVDDLYGRYPFFRSTSAERRKLFGHAGSSVGAA